MMTRQEAISAALAYVPDYIALQRDYMPFVGGGGSPSPSSKA
jgi:hypothetical protein